MCRPTTGVRCTDAAAARSWWGSPFLAPRVARDAEYVLQEQSGRFAPGGAERSPYGSIAVVLTYGGPKASQAEQPAVLDGGGIIVLGIRAADRIPPSTDGHTVRIRGHVAAVSEAKSVTTRKVRRVISWLVADGDVFVEWNVIDDGTQRSLDEVVAIVDALAES